MKKLTILLLLVIAVFTKSHAQLINALPGLQWTSTLPSTKHDVRYGEDWYYGVMTASDGGFVGTGYAELPDPSVAIDPTHPYNNLIKQPTAVKLDKDGKFLWETDLSDNNFSSTSQGASGYGLQIIEDNVNGYYIVFGYKVKTYGSNAYASSGHFSARLDRTTGAIDPTWGIKYYNANTLGLDAFGYIHMSLGYSWAEEIRDNLGNITGFVISSSINKFDNTGAPSGNNLDYASLHGVAIKLDANGNIDTGVNGFVEASTPGALGFKFLGVGVFAGPAAGFLVRNTQLSYATVDYSSPGVVNGFVFTGSENESPSVYQNDAPYSRNACLYKTDLQGNIIWTKNFDATIPNYTDDFTTDNNPCPANNIKTADEVGAYVEQITPGGDFIMVAQFNKFVKTDASPCINNRVTDQGFYQTDPAVIRFDPSGNFKWAINIPNSTGIDFFNPLKLINNNTEAIVGGSYAHPTDNTVMPQITKLNIASATTPIIEWTHQYMDYANNQQNVCLFGLDYTLDNGYVMAGNDDAGLKTIPNGQDEDYSMMKTFDECSSLQPYDITDPTFIININTTVNWNSSHKVLGAVRINTGGVLNIIGGATTIEFADTKLTGVPTHIEIYGNGKLNVNGATLTSISACPNSMWDGIQLFGNGNAAAQTVNGQPKVTLASAKLTNARLGIANGMDISPAGPSPYSSGGIVIANSSIFLNNFIDVNFLDYASPLVNGNEPNNKSYFRGCTFISNNFLNDPTYVGSINTGNVGRLLTNTHVILNGVKGVAFIANIFKTDLTAIGGIAFNTNKRSIGIKSNNSTFNIYSTCLTQDICGNCTGYNTPNTFENLRYGLYAQSTNPLKNFTINNANFTNCYSSLYQSGINYSTITKNKFEINTTIPSAGGGKACAYNPISCGNYFYYATNSSGFTHQENDYKVTSTQKVLGTIFNACGNAANESYHNKYTSCYVGHQTQQTNGSTSVGMNGLQIKCNQNVTTKQYDIAQTSGVIGQQGQCLGVDVSTPANNTFSHFQTTPPSDINGYTGGGFAYKYTPAPINGIQDPIYKTANVIKTGCLSLGNFVYNTQTCPSKLNPDCGTGGGPPLIAKLQATATNNKQIADNLAAILKQNLAAGDAPSLLVAINGGMSDGNLKNLLVSKSPYLSDAVMIAYLQKTSSPPPGNIKEVILANSPVSTSVKAVLDNMNLPNGIRNQINAGQVGTSVINQKIQEIAYYNFNKDIAVNDIVTYYLNDTLTPYAYENIIKWLEWNNTIKTKYDLIFATADRGNFIRAQQVIDSVAIVTNNAPHVQFMQQHKNLKATHKTWKELKTNTSLKTQILSIANDSLSPLFTNAKAALTEAFTNMENYEVIESISSNNARLGNNTTIQEQSSVYDSKLLNITAYPNPFNNSVSDELDERETDNAIEIKLLELASGKLISKQTSTKGMDVIQFNTENLANGVYMINVSNHGISISNTKIINIR
jgi:hypothetical protein